MSSSCQGVSPELFGAGGGGFGLGFGWGGGGSAFSVFSDTGGCSATVVVTGGMLLSGLGGGMLGFDGAGGTSGSGGWCGSSSAGTSSSTGACSACSIRS